MSWISEIPGRKSGDPCHRCAVELAMDEHVRGDDAVEADMKSADRLCRPKD